LLPISRPTGVSTDRVTGWQPEQDEAPGGASAAIAPPNGSHSSTTQMAVRFEIMPALAKSWNRRGAAVARRSV